MPIRIISRETKAALPGCVSYNFVEISEETAAKLKQTEEKICECANMLRDRSRFIEASLAQILNGIAPDAPDAEAIRQYIQETQKRLQTAIAALYIFN